MSQALRPPRLIARAPSSAVYFQICHGADWNDCAQLRELGVPINLTGCGIELVIRPTYEDPIRLASLTSGAGDILFDDPLTGKFQIYWEVGKVNLLPAGRWVHVMRLTKAGEDREICRGPFEILPARYEL